MVQRVESLVEAVEQAVRLIADRAVAINPWWLGAAVVLCELSQVVRTRGWFNILRAAYPDARDLRARDAAGAYLAGAGLNALLPARSGDFLKLFMVRRRMPGARYSTLAATFVPETLFEFLFGAALAGWALAQGFLPIPVTPSELPELDLSLVLVHPVLFGVAGALLSVAAVVLARALRRRGTAIGGRVRQGVAILLRPSDFVLGVASWQALGRLIRLASLACFMTAVGLPLTFGTVVLVMAAQGAGRIVPLAPVSAGLRVAMLSYGFAEVTDTPVDIAAITTFWFTVGAAHLIAGVALALGVVAATFGTISPRRALASARRTVRLEQAGPTEAPAAAAAD